MKKPGEIIKGLEGCEYGCQRCYECPYSTRLNCDDPYDPARDCVEELKTDALALIQQLESKLNQAVEDIRMLGRTGEFICPVCAHYNHGEGTKGECVKCLTGDGFRWRGAKMDGGAEG